MAKNYWMFVQSSDNFHITKQMGFRLHGLAAKYRRRADRMQPDDHVLYYVRDTKRWTALATIRSKAFEDRSPLWNPTQRGEDFRHRVKMAPRLVLEDDEAVDALLLAPRLEYLKRWAPELWPLAFMDSVHLLPQRDFRLIEAEMERIRDATAGRGNSDVATPAASPESGEDLPVGALVRPAPDTEEWEGTDESEGLEDADADAVTNESEERREGDGPSGAPEEGDEDPEGADRA